MKRFRWLIVWLLQFAAAFVVSGLLSLSLWLGHAAYGVCMWALLPVAGCISAYLATVNGLLNYAAWIAPPVAMALSHMAVWYYPPEAGPVLLCAFVSLVGAAAGEVVLRTNEKDK